MKPISYSHVFVIESLRHNDVKTGASLFNDIIRRRMDLRGHGNNARFIEVNSRTEFFAAMEEIRRVEIQELANPILHFEMHGDENGIQLSNDESVSWPELQFHLLQANGICGNNLFVSMATCRGANIHKLIQPSAWAPYWGFMGAFEDVDEAEVLADYTVFYDEFLQSDNFDRAIEALRASNTAQYSKFRFQNTEYIFQKAYQNYEVFHMTPDRITERLQEMVDTCRPNPVFNTWTDEDIRSLGRMWIVDNANEMKSKMMQKFFMLDRFPDQAHFYDIHL